VSGPLAGLRVLELTNFIAGPFCGCLLSDLGADVIKVEIPGVGDHARVQPPIVGGDGVGFMALNRGKRSLALNIKRDAGREVFLRLVDSGDALIENMRPGTLADLGLAPDALMARNPGLIVCSLSGFGQTGPWSERAGLDLIAQAMSGIMSITGEPGGAPVKCGVPVADQVSALYGALSITAAAHERARSRRGQHIDLSLFECALSLGVWETAAYFGTGIVPGPIGSAHRAAAPYQAFRCADGYITFGAVTPASWHGACVALGLEHLEHDPGYATIADRKLREIELASQIEDVTVQRPRAYWQGRLEMAGVPCGPILRYDETLATDHTVAREMVGEFTHPRAGSMRAVASPVKMGRTAVRRPSAAPLLGEHSREILQEIRIGDEEIARLIDIGIVQEGRP